MVLATLRQLRSARSPRPFSTIGLMLGSGLFACGMGLGIGNVLELCYPRGSGRVLGWRDEEMKVGVLMAGTVWVAFMAWYWIGALRQRWVLSVRVVWPVIGTLACIGAVVGGLVLLEVLDLGRLEHGELTVIALGAGVAVLLWLPLLNRIDSALSLTSQAGPDIRCPNCEYPLNGLREAMCPECGTGYTLDELIRRQR